MDWYKWNELLIVTRIEMKKNKERQKIFEMYAYNLHKLMIDYVSVSKRQKKKRN